MPQTLEDAAAEFLSRPRRGADAAAEDREVHKFVARMGRAQAPAGISPGQVEDYVKRLVPGWDQDTDMARALRSNPSAQAHLRAVQSFLRWLRRQELTPTDLGAVIKLPSKTQGNAPAKNLHLDLSLRLRDKPATFYHDAGLPPANVRLGIDFGTSNTSVALFDGRRVTLFPIDPANYAPQTCRSLLYMKRSGGRFIGKEALKTYFADNADRAHHWVRRVVGQHEYISEFTKVGNFYLDVDEASPGRFFESLKTGLRSTITVNTLLMDPTPPRGTPPSGVMYSVEDLIGEFLAEVKSRAEAAVGGRVDEIYLGRPVHFSLTPGIDESAAEHLQAAAAAAGFRRVIFEYEPVAAAFNYELTLKAPQNVLVFDFGGGTLDVTVMRMGSGQPARILSLDGVPIGGDDLDHRIMEGKLLKYFGQGVTLGPGRQEFPRHMLDRITRWQTIRELDNPKTLQFLREVESTASSPRAIRALRTLIAYDLSLPLYEEIERAKIDLSSKEETLIRMYNRDIAITERITRIEFEHLIAPELEAIGVCVDRVVAASGLQPEQIDVVLRTGGSSSIPAFVRLLEKRFGPAKIRKQDVFTGIAAGLGIAGYRSLLPPAARTA
ncbi:MAG TPA: Hsp70 family protein [Chloroflexia bacterium]|nr:Hsp70 family protein [Chloroflexia bacterium]